MYEFPSTSVTRQPCASLMNRGVPPTALNARTGDDTPPGMNCFALRNAASELAMERVRSGIEYNRGKGKEGILEGRARRRNAEGRRRVATRAPSPPRRGV